MSCVTSVEYVVTDVKCVISIYIHPCHVIPVEPRYITTLVSFWYVCVKETYHNIYCIESMLLIVLDIIAG